MAALSFERWLFDQFKETFSDLNAARLMDGVSLRLSDRATLSRYQVQESYELLVSQPDKTTASSMTEQAATVIGSLPEHNYVHTTAIDGTAAQRQNDPGRWVYSTIFTVTRRRDINDWSEVE